MIAIRQIQLTKLARKLTTGGIALLSFAGLTEVGFSQTLPLESPAPAVLPSSIPTPTLITPDLPAIGEFSRYQPQDQTIHLLLKLRERKVYVYQGEKLLASYPVAVGRPEFPTPTGEFEVFEMIVNPAWQSPWTGEVETPGPDGSLGVRWIGFTKMPNGVIGFHGTPNVASIGTAASHGCVRMRNEDIVKLYEHVKVGTLVRVES